MYMESKGLKRPEENIQFMGGEQGLKNSWENTALHVENRKFKQPWGEYLIECGAGETKQPGQMSYRM